MKLSAAVALVVLSLSAPVDAQPDQPTTKERKSPRVAEALAWVGTLVGPALSLANFGIDPSSPDERRLGYSITAGSGVLMVLGPSLGHWYGSERFVSPGLGARAGGAVLMTTGFIAFRYCISPDVDCGRRDPETYATIGLLGIGAIALIGGSVLDVLDAAPAARRWNRKHGVEAVLAPTVTPSGAGLAVAGRF